MSTNLVIDGIYRMSEELNTTGWIKRLVAEELGYTNIPVEMPLFEFGCKVDNLDEIVIAIESKYEIDLCFCNIEEDTLTTQMLIDAVEERIG